MQNSFANFWLISFQTNTQEMNDQLTRMAIISVVNQMILVSCSQSSLIMVNWILWEAIWSIVIHHLTSIVEAKIITNLRKDEKNDYSSFPRRIFSEPPWWTLNLNLAMAISWYFVINIRLFTSALRELFPLLQIQI